MTSAGNQGEFHPHTHTHKSLTRQSALRQKKEVM